MNDCTRYSPGPARGANVEKGKDSWTLILVRDLRHSPEKVWRALTEPEHLREWAPFDADGSLATPGAKVRLTTVGGGVAEATVTRAEAPHLLEYQWWDKPIRWQLDPFGSGTRLTLWHAIDRRYIAWGAAGWHICIDVLDRHLASEPIARIVGADAMRFEWQRLNTEYAQQFGVESPAWQPATAKR